MTSDASARTEPRDDRCPLDCGYRYPIPACVRLHLIQHHDCLYDEAQRLHPDEEPTEVAASSLTSDGGSSVA